MDMICKVCFGNMVVKKEEDYPGNQFYYIKCVNFHHSSFRIFIKDNSIYTSVLYVDNDRFSYRKNRLSIMSEAGDSYYCFEVPGLDFTDKDIVNKLRRIKKLQSFL